MGTFRSRQHLIQKYERLRKAPSYGAFLLFDFGTSDTGWAASSYTCESDIKRGAVLSVRVIAEGERARTLR